MPLGRPLSPLTLLATVGKWRQRFLRPTKRTLRWFTGDGGKGASRRGLKSEV